MAVVPVSCSTSRSISASISLGVGSFPSASHSSLACSSSSASSRSSSASSSSPGSASSSSSSKARPFSASDSGLSSLRRGGRSSPSSSSRLMMMSSALVARLTRAIQLGSSRSGCLRVEVANENVRPYPDRDELAVSVRENDWTRECMRRPRVKNEMVRPWTRIEVRTMQYVTGTIMSARRSMTVSGGTVGVGSLVAASVEIKMAPTPMGPK